MGWTLERLETGAARAQQLEAAMTVMDLSLKRAVGTIVGVFLVAGACVAMTGPVVPGADLQRASWRLAGGWLSVRTSLLTRVSSPEEGLQEYPVKMRGFVPSAPCFERNLK